MQPSYMSILLFGYPVLNTALFWLLFWDGNYFYPTQNLFLGLGVGVITIACNLGHMYGYHEEPSPRQMRKVRRVMAAQLMVPLAAILGQLVAWVLMMQVRWPALVSATFAFFLIHRHYLTRYFHPDVQPQQQTTVERGREMTSAESLYSRIRDNFNQDG